MKTAAIPSNLWRTTKLQDVPEEVMDLIFQYISGDFKGMIKAACLNRSWKKAADWSIRWITLPLLIYPPSDYLLINRYYDDISDQQNILWGKNKGSNYYLSPTSPKTIRELFMTEFVRKHRNWDWYVRWHPILKSYLRLHEESIKMIVGVIVIISSLSCVMMGVCFHDASKAGFPSNRFYLGFTSIYIFLSSCIILAGDMILEAALQYVVAYSDIWKRNIYINRIYNQASMTMSLIGLLCYLVAIQLKLQGSMSWSWSLTSTPLWICLSCSNILVYKAAEREATGWPLFVAVVSTYSFCTSMALVGYSYDTNNISLALALAPLFPFVVLLAFAVVLQVCRQLMKLSELYVYVRDCSGDVFNIFYGYFNGRSGKNSLETYRRILTAPTSLPSVPDRLPSTILSWLQFHFPRYSNIDDKRWQRYAEQFYDTLDTISIFLVAFGMLSLCMEAYSPNGFLIGLPLSVILVVTGLPVSLAKVCFVKEVD